ncbi:hypothetical protein G7Y89_g10647 [Cudoniella acicularis]|uniref:Uncharacterized protein n=1 Tax=Cudoniella acicularis TaxID=354080 RepID=A0A8H4RG08_9HELO|nr:hypothetical protein G7Y89_g10647 [Cudoniella acicularis]
MDSAQCIRATDCDGQSHSCTCSSSSQECYYECPQTPIRNDQTSLHSEEATYYTPTATELEVISPIMRDIFRLIEDLEDTKTRATNPAEEEYYQRRCKYWEGDWEEFRLREATNIDAEDKKFWLEKPSILNAPVAQQSALYQPKVEESTEQQIFKASKIHFMLAPIQLKRNIESLEEVDEYNLHEAPLSIKTKRRRFVVEEGNRTTMSSNFNADASILQCTTEQCERYDLTLNITHSTTLGKYQRSELQKPAGEGNNDKFGILWVWRDLILGSEWAFGGYDKAQELLLEMAQLVWIFGNDVENLMDIEEEEYTKYGL